MHQSKQIIDSKIRTQSTKWEKFSDWIDDSNPTPYSVQFWWRDQDWLHPARIFRKIANIIRWIPILWQDRDWDYTSLYVIIYTKIQFMRDHQEEHHHHTDWMEVVAQMQCAEDCLRRLEIDDYASDQWKSHHDKFPRDLTFTETADGMRKMEPLSEEATKSFLIVSSIEGELREKDLKDFSSTFSKHVREWWD